MSASNATSSQSPSISTQAIWAIAIPAMLTNIATALIGVGDMWIVGQMDSTSTQGAVDVGARIFAVLFTVMNFLKTGTTGMVAQEGERAGAESQVMVLVKGLFVALVIGALVLLAKPIILPFALDALGAQETVRAEAETYAEIRYWTAPGVMLNLALMGYLIGRRQMTAVLIFEVGYNLLNVGLGLWLALRLDWGIAGIGWSSFAAEYAKLLVVSLFVFRGTVSALALKCLSKVPFRWNSIKPFLSVNRDLFFRTVILMIAIGALTRLSAERGDAVLAANGIMYQMFVLTALLLDGFENAAQVLTGERIGAKDRAGFAAYVKAILWRGFAAAGVVSILFLLLGPFILAQFAATPEVLAEAEKVGWWLAIIPIAGVAGFVFDGVYVGASWTRALLGTMVVASLLYAALLWLTWPLGNQGIWLSFTAFLAIRAVLQALWLPRLTKHSIAS